MLKGKNKENANSIDRGSNAPDLSEQNNKTDHCIVLQGVNKHFEGLHAVKDVDLTVKQGERLAIIGPNGAGKTTLFNLISGEFPPTSGKIFMYGNDVTSIPNHKRVYYGLARTYQITELFFGLSVLDNVVLAIQGNRPVKFSMWKPLAKHEEIYREAFELLNSVGLKEKKDEIVKNLSYGDQRLIELVLALASKPSIIALDEPTAGLSLAESAIMVDVLKKLSSEITLLIIEHDMQVAFEIAERVMVLHNGEVVDVDTTEKCRANPKVQECYLGKEEEYNVY